MFQSPFQRGRGLNFGKPSPCVLFSILWVSIPFSAGQRLKRRYRSYLRAAMGTRVSIPFSAGQRLKREHGLPILIARENRFQSPFQRGRGLNLNAVEAGLVGNKTRVSIPFSAGQRLKQVHAVHHPRLCQKWFQSPFQRGRGLNETRSMPRQQPRMRSFQSPFQRGRGLNRPSDFCLSDRGLSPYFSSPPAIIRCTSPERAALNSAEGVKL